MKIDISGQKFGRITVINKVYKINKKNSYYLCECECGNKLEIAATSLVSGKTQSCGCLKQELWISDTRDKAGFVENTCISTLKSKLSARNTSGIKGVTWDKKRGKWLAQIGFQGKTYNLGRFYNIIDAKKAREKAEENTHNKFIEWYENEQKN